MESIEMITESSLRYVFTLMPIFGSNSHRTIVKLTTEWTVICLIWETFVWNCQKTFLLSGGSMMYSRRIIGLTFAKNFQKKTCMKLRNTESLERGCAWLVQPKIPHTRQCFFPNHQISPWKLKLNYINSLQYVIDLLITSDLIHLETERRNECLFVLLHIILVRHITKQIKARTYALITCYTRNIGIHRKWAKINQYDSGKGQDIFKLKVTDHLRHENCLWKKVNFLMS